MKLKKLNNKRKVLLTLASVASIAAPLATVVSCDLLGSTSKEKESITFTENIFNPIYKVENGELKMDVKKLSEKYKNLIFDITPNSSLSLNEMLTISVHPPEDYTINGKEEYKFQYQIQQLPSTLDASNFFSTMTAQFSPTSMTLSKHAPNGMHFEYSIGNAMSWNRVQPTNFPINTLVYIKLVSDNSQLITGKNDKLFLVENINNNLANNSGQTSLIPINAENALQSISPVFTSGSMVVSTSPPTGTLFQYSVDGGQNWSPIPPSMLSNGNSVHMKLVVLNPSLYVIQGNNDKTFVVNGVPATQPVAHVTQQPSVTQQPPVSQPVTHVTQQPPVSQPVTHVTQQPPVSQPTTTQQPQSTLHARNASALALTVDRFPVLQKHAELLTNPRILSFLKDWNDIVGGIDNLDASLDVAYLNNIKAVLAKYTELPTITTSFGAGDVGGTFAFINSLLRVGIPGHFSSFGAGAYELATAMDWFNNMFLKLCPTILSKSDILENIDVSGIPAFVENQDYEVGIKVLYKGKLWKLLQAYRGATDSSEYNIEEEYGPGGLHALWEEIQANLINMPSGTETAQVAMPFVLGDDYDTDDVVIYEGRYYRAVKHYTGTWSEDAQNLPGGPHTGTGAPDDEWEEVSNPAA